MRLSELEHGLAKSSMKNRGCNTSPLNFRLERWRYIGVDTSLGS